MQSCLVQIGNDLIHFCKQLTTLTTRLSWRICSVASTRHLLFTLLQPPCFFQKAHPILVNDLSK